MPPEDEPEAPVHGECAAEISRLTQELNEARKGRVPALDKPAEGLLSMKDEGPAHYIHADGCFYLVSDTSELGRLSALNFIKVVNELHASIVKPLREKADDLAEDLKEANEFGEKAWKDRDALKRDVSWFKSEMEAIGRRLELKISEKDTAVKDAKRLAEAMAGLVFTHGEPCADQSRGLGECQAVRLGKEALTAHEALKEGAPVRTPEGKTDGR